MMVFVLSFLIQLNLLAQGEYGARSSKVAGILKYLASSPPVEREHSTANLEAWKLNRKQVKVLWKKADGIDIEGRFIKCGDSLWVMKYAKNRVYSSLGTGGVCIALNRADKSLRVLYYCDVRRYFAEYLLSCDDLSVEFDNLKID